jgi:hypothetical protein
VPEDEDEQIVLHVNVEDDIQEAGGKLSQHTDIEQSEQRKERLNEAVDPTKQCGAPLTESERRNLVTATKVYSLYDQVSQFQNKDDKNVVIGRILCYKQEKDDAEAQFFVYRSGNSCHADVTKRRVPEPCVILFSVRAHGGYPSICVARESDLKAFVEQAHRFLSSAGEQDETQSDEACENWLKSNELSIHFLQRNFVSGPFEEKFAQNTRLDAQPCVPWSLALRSAIYRTRLIKGGYGLGNVDAIANTSNVDGTKSEPPGVDAGASGRGSTGSKRKYNLRVRAPVDPLGKGPKSNEKGRARKKTKPVQKKKRKKRSRSPAPDATETDKRLATIESSLNALTQTLMTAPQALPLAMPPSSPFFAQASPYPTQMMYPPYAGFASSQSPTLQFNINVLAPSPMSTVPIAPFTSPQLAVTPVAGPKPAKDDENDSSEKE